jgi:hypothetical protein
MRRGRNTRTFVDKTYETVKVEKGQKKRRDAKL